MYTSFIVGSHMPDSCCDVVSLAVRAVSDKLPQPASEGIAGSRGLNHRQHSAALQVLVQLM